MNSVTPSSQTDSNGAFVDDEKTPLTDPVGQTFQNASPPSGLWKLWESAASYFSSRQVNKIEEPAPLSEALPPFVPYELTLEFPKAKTTYPIKDQADESNVVQGLKMWFHKHSESIKILDGIEEEAFCLDAADQNRRIRNVFTANFHLHYRKDDVYEWIGPKPIVQTE